MFIGPGNRTPVLCIVAILLASAAHALSGASWSGVLADGANKPIAQAVIKLHSANHDYTATTTGDGRFSFPELAAGNYQVSATVAGKEWKTSSSLEIKEASTLMMALQISASSQELHIIVPGGGQNSEPAASAQASGGEHLSSAAVSSLPLNERDFSKLLLLAAGTMTDTNGAANFTQQFAVNGQRGVASVFAMDGADTTDP